jgi:hypothetical protein
MSFTYLAADESLIHIDGLALAANLTASISHRQPNPF